MRKLVCLFIIPLMILSCSTDPNKAINEKKNLQTELPSNPNNNLFQGYINPGNWCNYLGTYHNEVINYIIDNADAPPNQGQICGLVVQYFINDLDEFDSSDSLNIYNALLAFESLEYTDNDCYNYLNFKSFQIETANRIYSAIDYYLNTDYPYTYFYDSLMVELSDIENEVLNSSLTNYEKEPLLTIVTISKHSLNLWTEKIYPEYFTLNKINHKKKGYDKPMGLGQFFEDVWDGVQSVAKEVWKGVKKDARGALYGATEAALSVGAGALIGGPVTLKGAAGVIAGGAAVGAVKSSTGWF